MIVFLGKLKKRFPRLYNYFKNNNFVKDFFIWFVILIKIIKKEKKFIRFYIKTTFTYYVLQNKSDIQFNYKGYALTMPRHLKGFEGFIEVMTDGFYDKLKGFDNILDLGGYIGDSGLKLSSINKFVTVYEAHPGNFKYLLLNTKSIGNIKSYNFAVVGNDSKFLDFDGGDFNEGAKIGESSNTIKVKCKNILDILNEKVYDGLKMDIEGAEYECFDLIIKNPKNFLFKRGFIEFHFWEKEMSLVEKTNNIINRLKTLGYSIKIYSVIPEYKEIKNIDKLKTGVCLVYFYK